MRKKTFLKIIELQTEQAEKHLNELGEQKNAVKPETV